jgi:hypothetical protein
VDLFLFVFALIAAALNVFCVVANFRKRNWKRVLWHGFIAAMAVLALTGNL